MVSFLILANAVLVVLTSIFIVKEILIDFKESKSKIKNISIYVLTIIVLFLSLIIGRQAFFISEYQDTLESELRNELRNENKKVIIENAAEIKEDTERTLEELKSKENVLILYTVLGYVLFGCTIAFNNNIRKEIKNRKSEGKWDIKKL